MIFLLMKSRERILGFSFYLVEKVSITVPLRSDLFFLQTSPTVPLCKMVKSATYPLRLMISSGWVILRQTAYARLKMAFLFRELKKGTSKRCLLDYLMY